MKDSLRIKWPWEMVWMESVDDLTAMIKDALPSDHPLQSHDLFPGIKWDKRVIFIVDDDTTGEYLLIDFEKMKRGKNSTHKVPAITVIKTRAEVAALINRDHKAEIAKYNPDGTLKPPQNEESQRPSIE
ncbi:MAG: hypothetical protein KDN22_02575 [Verrucomicrobiae bacterium]|nr:hypothetical protein [Verrucomicrobiae bacterium]